MISNHLIKKACDIRKEYKILVEKLNLYNIEVKNLSIFLTKIANEIFEYNNTEIKKTKNIETVKSYLISKLDEIETESKKLTDAIAPINNRIESLKKEEIVLYQVIKESYPKMSDEAMRNEIFKHII